MLSAVRYRTLNPETNNIKAMLWILNDFFRISIRHFRLFRILIRILFLILHDFFSNININFHFTPEITTRYNLLQIADLVSFIFKLLGVFFIEKQVPVICFLFCLRILSPDPDPNDFFQIQIRIRQKFWVRSDPDHNFVTLPYIVFSSQRYETVYFNDNTIRQNIYFNCKCAKQRSKRKSL